jgi:hypothetical protein
MSPVNNNGIWSLLNEDVSITELKKENRALDMEMMEMAMEIRKLKDDLAFFKSFHGINHMQ